MQNEQSATDSTLRDEDKSDNPTNPNGNVPDTSVDKGTTILKTSKEEIIRRVSGDRNRPLLQGGALEDKVTALMNAREAIYMETAHEEVVTDGKSVGELVVEIQKFA